MPLLPLSCLFYLHLISLPVALSLLPTQDLCTCSSSFFLGHSPLIGLFELLFIKYSFTYLFYSGWDGFPLPFEIRLDGVICLGICSRMSENMTQIMVCLWDRVYPLVPLSSSRGGGTCSSWPACPRRRRLTWWHRCEHNFQLGAKHRQAQTETAKPCLPTSERINYVERIILP